MKRGLPGHSGLNLGHTSPNTERFLFLLRAWPQEILDPKAMDFMEDLTTESHTLMET